MSSIPFVDCQGLAGAWSLGIVQAGFELQHRASLGAFGDEVIGGNRHLVGDNWTQDEGNSYLDWEPKKAGLVAGTPPCSGFSLLNKSKKANARGADSAINSCMWELVRYAAKCRGTDGKPGPEIVSFESVQGAYTQGRSLMQKLRAGLEEDTGQKYDLIHVLCSGATVGAAQMRRRYYFVCSRVPFGIDMPEKRRVAVYEDAIGDLVGLDYNTWDEQTVEYDDAQTWWLREQNQLGPILEAGAFAEDRFYYRVRDHIAPYGERIEFMVNELVPVWGAGMTKENAMRAYRDKHGEFPDKMKKWWLEDEDKIRGFTHEYRIKPDIPGHVLTGGGAFSFIHYSEPRFLTVRECARLMGYPDTWTWEMARNVTQASSWIGKCCPVNTGRWIGGWFRRAIEGNPGTGPLEEVGKREYVHQSTNLYRNWLKEQREEALVAA